MHRLGLSIGDRAEAPAVYVRAADLGVERLEQRYQRVGDPAEPPTFDYTAASFAERARGAFFSRRVFILAAIGSP